MSQRCKEPSLPELRWPKYRALVGPTYTLGQFGASGDRCFGGRHFEERDAPPVTAKILSVSRHAVHNLVDR